MTGGLRSDLHDRGVELVLSYAPELFATADLDHDRVAFAGLASLEIDVDLGTVVQPRLGRCRCSSMPACESPHDGASTTWRAPASRSRDRGAQTLVEATYQLAATGWLTLQPDVQLLRHEGNAVIGALRAVFVF